MALFLNLYTYLIILKISASDVCETLETTYSITGLHQKIILPKNLFVSLQNCAVVRVSTVRNQPRKNYALSRITRYRDSQYRDSNALSVQKVLSGFGPAGRLRLMGKYIGRRLVARPEPDNTFWTDSTNDD